MHGEHLLTSLFDLTFADQFAERSSV